MLAYSFVIVPAIIVILLILSAVGLGSVNKIDADKPVNKTDLDNTRRSLQGLVVMSVGIILYYFYSVYQIQRVLKAQ